MVPDTLQIALKEWALVQRALLEGQQIILLRKGGLIEDTGEFDLKSRDFLLMPTYIHETERAGDVQPAYRNWLRAEEQRKPSQNVIRFEAACQVTDMVKVPNREPLKLLASEHIWTDQFVDGRFDWEPYKPVFALFCRAYRLPVPVEVPFENDYGGCRSWIELLAPIDVTGMIAAIASDDEYADRVARVRGCLQG